MTPGAPDRLVTYTCTIAWVESIIHDFREGNIPGHAI